MQAVTNLGDLRPAAAADREQIVDLVVAAGMFARDEARLVEELLQAHLGTEGLDDHRCTVLELDGRVDGVAFAQPRAAADRVWDLTMLGVRPGRQHAGIGTALIEQIEQDLSTTQRLLVVETSSTDAYAPARAFYRARGYDEAARVRDYWTDGDDLVVFRKDLRS